MFPVDGDAAFDLLGSLYDAIGVLHRQTMGRRAGFVPVSTADLDAARQALRATDPATAAAGLVAAVSANPELRLALLAALAGVPDLSADERAMLRLAERGGA